MEKCSICSTQFVNTPALSTIEFVDQDESLLKLHNSCVIEILKYLIDEYVSIGKA